MDNHRTQAHPSAGSIGRRLKEAREKKSLTIEQVQKQSRIHSSVIIALEEGRASELLTDTYVRSFLKQYSQLLGLPTGELLKEYFPPRQEQTILSVPADDSPMPYETKVMPKVLYFTGIAVLGITILAAILFAGSKIVSAVNKSRLTHQEKRVAAVSSSKKKQPKSAKAVQNKKKTPAKTEKKPGIAIPESTPLSLTIKIKESILVTLKKDGLVMYSVIMKKDTVETVTAKESIELGVTKTDALDLTLNGQKISLPPRNGISGLVITRKGVRLK